MTSRTYDWPRLYLLNLYRDAVERGHIVVEGLSEPQAQSLKMAFYRLRRRSDTSNKTMILPEYHLVTCGEWRSSGLDTDGTMSILYNSIPDGSLPSVRDAVTGDLLPTIAERSYVAPQGMIVLPPAEPLALDTNLALGLDAEISPSDISDYVANLRKRASHD